MLQRQRTTGDRRRITEEKKREINKPSRIWVTGERLVCEMSSVSLSLPPCQLLRTNFFYLYFVVRRNHLTPLLHTRIH